MFGWTLHGNGKDVAPDEVVAPGERLNWPATMAMGVQHVVAMFGATFLVPTLTGFPVPTTLLFSGIGTILFLLITRNRMPSYLGSSFAFIAPITAATASGAIGSALAGVVAVGVLLAIVGIVVQVAGIRWVDALMPPVVAGAIVALIGFNLAPTAWGISRPTRSPPRSRSRRRFSPPSCSADSSAASPSSSASRSVSYTRWPRARSRCRTP